MCTLEEVNSTMIRHHRFSNPNLSYNYGPIVKAGSFIRKDSTSEIVDLTNLSQTCISTINSVEIIESEGRLCSSNKLINVHFWLKIVNVAVNCQTYNIVLIESERGVMIKAIRDISPGEMLFLWFSENLLIILNMPFLTIKNIQSHDRYICDTCYNVYEHPNLLKIHMFLNCDRLDRNHLWNVLAREFAYSQNLIHQRSFLFQLSASRNVIFPDFVDTVNSYLYSISSPTFSNQPSSSSSEPSISPHSLSSTYLNEQDTSQRISAFKPYEKANRSKSVSNVRPSSRVNAGEFHLRNNDVSSNPADIENYASNIGKSKNGYICIYCNKVYSRKYGLKIHIRTHTGFKPLICPYCKRAFGDPSNLNKHTRLHRYSKSPYKCNICGKVLVRRRDLDRHIKTKHENNNLNTNSSDKESNA